MGKVLIAGECSNGVASHLRALGHDVTTADFKPNEVDQKHHYQGNYWDLLNGSHHWDMLLGHPTCTNMANSSVSRLTQKNPDGSLRYPNRMQDMQRDAEDFKRMLNTPHADRVMLENPVMHGYATRIIGEKSSFGIQPFQHGATESKHTRFHTRNVPPMKPTKVMPKPANGLWDNQIRGKSGKVFPKEAPSAQRATDRSRTRPTVAKAIAEHIHSLIPPPENKVKMSRRKDGSWYFTNAV